MTIAQFPDPAPIFLNVSHTNVRVTPTQFEQLCQDNPDLRLELTATGELITMAPAGWESSKRNMNLGVQVFLWNEKTKLGEVFDSSGGFTLLSGAIRSPDVTWIEKSKFDNISTNVAFPRLVPDFVIELRSKTDSLKTLQEKMVEYIDNGVRLGLLIDPQNQQVEIYRIGQDMELLQSPKSIVCNEISLELILDLTTIW
jgi:Uma2 family endonuclease